MAVKQAFIQSCRFCSRLQTLLPSVCDMGPLVAIKHLLCAHENPAAGAFTTSLNPTSNQTCEGKNRANWTIWAPGSCVSSCVCLHLRVHEGALRPGPLIWPHEAWDGR